MKLELILLGILAEQPRTGYDIKRYFDTFGRFLRSRTQMSQVYRTLASLEARGEVSHTVEPRPGATDAKIYSVTEEGISVFLDWLASPYVPPSRFQDPDLSVRFEFAGFMTRDQLVDLIDTELTTRRAEIKRYRHRSRAVALSGDWPFDEALASTVAQWAHETGADAMDRHLERLELLRRAVLGHDADH
jgi:DNA-binding PadR family transcriptional regulator